MGILILDEEEKKMIESQQPLYRITVNYYRWKKDCSYFMGKNDRRKGSQKQKTVTGYWAKRNTSDEFFIMRYFDIDPLLKKRSYFFPE